MSQSKILYYALFFGSAAITAFAEAPPHRAGAENVVIVEHMAFYVVARK
jgi:hypothetical protein